MLPGLTGEPWDELRFAQLRRTFRGQLRRRGAMEQWDFAHGQMRVAALGWIAEGMGPTGEALHTALGDHLLGLAADDPAAWAELGGWLHAVVDALDA